MHAADAADVLNRRNDIDDVVSAVADDAIDLEPERRQRQPQLARGRVSGTLVLLGPKNPEVGDDDRRSEEILLRQREGIRKPKSRVHRIASMGALARFFKKRRKIRRLLLSFHTDHHANMLVGNEWARIDGARIRDALASVKVHIDYLEFQSCRVGFRPDRMAAFGRVLNARTVVGWTAWRVVQLNRLPLIGKDATKTNIRRVLQAVEGYLATGSPTIEEILAMKKRGRRKSIDLVIEGFLRGSLPGDRQRNALRIPAFTSEDPIDDFFAATRKLDPRDKAEERIIDADTIGEVAEPTTAELITHFCRVTVNLPRAKPKKTNHHRPNDRRP